MRFVVFGILDMRWKYRKMVKPQERLFMQSKRLHKESFLWNDLFHDKNKSEPIANRRKVRIYSLWWTRGGSNSRTFRMRTERSRKVVSFLPMDCGVWFDENDRRGAIKNTAFSVPIRN